MRIGIAYDTLDMYDLQERNSLHYDFANIESINILKQLLDSIGHNAILLGNTYSIAKSIQAQQFDCDIVYNTVEGINSRNREGLLPALLEIFGIPYIGTDAFGLSLTLNKALTKVLEIELGILTPKYVVATPNSLTSYISKSLSNMKSPFIIKPNYEGNSSGICTASTKSEAINKIEQLIEQYQTSILCEEFIFGREITVPMIGNDFSNMLWGITTVDVQRNDDFWLDTNLKLYGDYNNVILELPTHKEADFKTISYKLFSEIGCRDFARFDYRLAPSGEIYFIEANPLPSLFSGCSFDVVGEKYGYTFAETIDKIVQTACDRLSIPKI